MPKLMSFGDPVQAISVEDYELLMKTMKAENYSRNDTLRADQ